MEESILDKLKKFHNQNPMEESILDKFKKFHNQNPMIWKLFKKYTFAAINSGRKHYSSKTIFERIRWHVDIETRGSSFKINNNYTAYYSRMFHLYSPENNDFFRTRMVSGININAELMTLI